ncbi:hypothetical protein SAMN04488510_10518 [Fervidobacterium changbaicum]|uniref:Uncharacterized protein n=1 Tax=Fervidobacterium changbaicum TaxID=310769 RepID=A0ABX5QUP4_9BACT|nr:hypothetical protein CBS1_04805 [Fervidobacterium changbaicum]SDH10621.1 hypothetical protein SAMN04488510_10518 [Fervidobacterium changbaicum]
MLILLYTISIFLLVLGTVSSCMKLLNLQLPDGAYVVGEWNGWVPTEADKMTYSSEEDAYVFELPVASVTFNPSRSGPQFSIGWYKVIYKQGGVTKVSSAIPVWKENLGSDTKLTIYATPTAMVNGQAVGVGDSEKFKTALKNWSIGGEINGWNLSQGQMNWDSAKKVFLYERTNFTGEKKEYKYKLSRTDNDWKPWEMNYDGKKYDAGMGQDASFSLPEAGTYDVTFTYNPKFSILEVKYEKK